MGEKLLYRTHLTPHARGEHRGIRVAEFRRRALQSPLRVGLDDAGEDHEPNRRRGVDLREQRRRADVVHVREHLGEDRVGGFEDAAREEDVQRANAVLPVEDGRRDDVAARILRTLLLPRAAALDVRGALRDGDDPGDAEAPGQLRRLLRLLLRDRLRALRAERSLLVVHRDAFFGVQRRQLELKGVEV